MVYFQLPHKGAISKHNRVMAGHQALQGMEHLSQAHPMVAKNYCKQNAFYDKVMQSSTSVILRQIFWNENFCWEKNFLNFEI